MTRHISIGPWRNPELDDGLYDVTIHSAHRVKYGDGDNELLEIVMILDDAEELFVTRIYLPSNFSKKCQHRLWFFCRAIDLEPYNILDDPEIAVGRSLVVETTTIHSTIAYRCEPYSDVRRFLPLAIRNLEADI